MATQTRESPDITDEILEAIQNLPPSRDVEHCGKTFRVPSFDFYAVCPECKQKLKVRAMSGVPEIEDVFDAVFTWMNQPTAAKIADNRRASMQE